MRKPGGGVFHLEVIESGGFVKRQYKNLLFLDHLYDMYNDEENMKTYNHVLKKTQDNPLKQLLTVLNPYLNESLILLVLTNFGN